MKQFPHTFTTLPAEPRMSAECARFVNGLKILRSIDLHELEEVGIELRGIGWEVFMRDPFRWMIRASDADRERLWRVIEGRQPK